MAKTQSGIFRWCVRTAACGLAVGAMALETHAKDTISADIITPPEGWIRSENFLGLPVALLGPKTGAQRSVISITPAPSAPKGAFRASELQKYQSAYKDGREQWLRKSNGRSLAYLPFREEAVGQIKIKRIGYRYQLNGTEFTEESLFVECPRAIVHIKSLIPQERQTADAAAFDEMIRSVRCDTQG